ncbi:hypothetical protein NIES2100_26280 [Calothrix sp. NIES-2100]|uniref:hypothetical protein n=1 Tax=Calothrix sp. NIES-2100 TaxID=1954172 RepID=UPI000B6139B3|nr:hypothetical protein NIES2100_26280 [Calothrix sp. NIES-2100]
MWQQAVQKAGGKVPTGKIVKDIVQRIMERTQVPNTYQLGEVCQILAKDNPELRGKGGYWAIVAQVNNFSCTVRNWDGELTLGLKYLYIQYCLHCGTAECCSSPSKKIP